MDWTPTGTPVDPKTISDRPFPWKCGACGTKSKSPVVIDDYQAQLSHDGIMYPIRVPGIVAIRCSGCGSQHLPDESMALLNDELRNAAGILWPDDIAAGRANVGLSVAELAELVDAHPATVERWERGGQLQSRASDRLLRAIFAVPELREFLRGLKK
jgi:DNA-binding transcriptional regulator YiaG